jgi:hypothetical protein
LDDGTSSEMLAKRAGGNAGLEEVARACFLVCQNDAWWALAGAVEAGRGAVAGRIGTRHLLGWHKDVQLGIAAHLASIPLSHGPPRHLYAPPRTVSAAR